MRLVLVTAAVEAVVLVTVLPVADIAVGRGAELPVALIKNTQKSNEQFDVCHFNLSVLDAFYTFRYFTV